MVELPAICVIDTNVPLAAGGHASAGPCCVIACGEALQHVMKAGRLVLDSGDEIFKEYLGAISWAGHPTPASAFLKWVIDNRHNNQKCVPVEITPSAEDGRGYREFPIHVGLKSVDPDDRKFIAASAGHDDHPPILEATDSKWWGWKEALAECGIRVIFLCEKEIAATHKRKMGE